MKNLCALVLALIGIQSVLFAVSYRTSPDEWRGDTKFTDKITTGSGTSSGTTPLTINGAATSGILFQNDGVNSGYIGSTATTAFVLYKEDGSTPIAIGRQDGQWSLGINQNYSPPTYVPTIINGGKLSFRYPSADIKVHDIKIDSSTYPSQLPMVFTVDYTATAGNRIFSWNNGDDEVGAVFNSGKWVVGKKANVNYGGPINGIHGNLAVETPAEPTFAESGFFQISSNLGGSYGNRYNTSFGGGGFYFDTTANDGTPSIAFVRNAPGDTGSASLSYAITHGGDHLWYRSGGAIGMNYDGGIGQLQVSSEQNTAEIRAVGTQTSSANILIEGVMDGSSGNGSTFVRFTRGTAEIGRIWQNATTSVAYATSSDMRLKENLKDFSGLDLVSALKPYDFKWKDESLGVQRAYGFIAQEVFNVIPSVVGEGDTGEEITRPWSVDYGKIAPINTKAIQELKSEKDTEIAALQAENAAQDTEIASLKTAVTCLAGATTLEEKTTCVAGL